MLLVDTMMGMMDVEMMDVMLGYVVGSCLYIPANKLRNPYLCDFVLIGHKFYLRLVSLFIEELPVC